MEQKMQSWKNIIKKTVFLSVKVVLYTATTLLIGACSPSVNEEGSTIEEAALSGLENTENVWSENKTTLKGRALGTTFIIKTGEDSLRVTPKEINDLFNDFNAELSTYKDESLISQFNASDSVIDLNSTQYFKKCFELSQEIYNQTQGAFDPTVFPLVSLWGFFKDIEKAPSQIEIDSVLTFVGFENKQLYNYEKGILTKNDQRFKLVFNAIAKGQSVDVIAVLLDERGHESYFIEVGGEIRVKGMNDRGAKWVIGVDEPVEVNTGTAGASERKLENYIEVSNRAVATSGNYRDFYELDGKKYSHTISSVTGKPVRHNILSATVVANDAATADAYATAFMVMGVERSLALIKENPELEVDAYLLFDGEKGRIERAFSRGMLQYLMD